MQWVKLFGMLLVAVVVSQFIANQQAQASLVAYWSFDQQSGSDFLDSSGNNNTAVNNGNVTTVSGVVGNAANFAGNGILTVADSASLDSAADSKASRSVAFWFKTTTTSNLVVLEKGTDQHFVVQTESTTTPPGKISFRVDTVNTNRVMSNNPVNDGNWHHFVATFDVGAGNLMSLYIDGVLQATNTQASPAANDDPFVIGARPGSGGSLIAPFVGSLDELVVWSRPLAPPEIVALSQGVSPLSLFSTVALHPTYQYTGSIGPYPSSTRNDPNRTKLTDGVFGSTSIDDGKWVAFQDPSGLHGDNGQPQPQIDFSFGLKGLRITDVQVQYYRAVSAGIYEPDSMVIEFYQDPAFTQLVDTYTITGFSTSTDGAPLYLTYSFPSPVYAEYARVKFYNDDEWTWLGEVTFFGSVPEPSTWVLMVLGALGLAG
ncbi:MAG TPA: LamG domain-containing protein, partial [Thermoguttaceae bacterium]|nr:LamG domain-containing protein [Thermoguttaceae bacterium]